MGERMLKRVSIIGFVVVIIFVAIKFYFHMVANYGSVNFGLF